MIKLHNKFFNKTQLTCQINEVMFGSRKCEGKENLRKIKNRLKFNKLFLFVTSNSFYLF